MLAETFVGESLHLGPHANGIQRKQHGNEMQMNGFFFFSFKDQTVVSLRVRPQEIWTPVFADQTCGNGETQSPALRHEEQLRGKASEKGTHSVCWLCLNCAGQPGWAS